MAEEPQSPPPQSIVIGQLPDNPATQPVGQDERATSSETTGASGVTEEAVENYITVMDVKDNSNATAVLAAIFLFFIPLFLGLSVLDNFSNSDGGCGLCFGSIAIGTVLAIMSVTESTKNQQNQKNAKLRLLKEAGLQSPPASKVPLYVGVTSFAVLVLLNLVIAPVFYLYEYDLIYGLINASSFIGLLASGILSWEGDHRRKKTINQLVNVIVDKETKKPGT